MLSRGEKGGAEGGGGRGTEKGGHSTLPHSFWMPWIVFDVA